MTHPAGSAEGGSAEGARLQQAEPHVGRRAQRAPGPRGVRDDAGVAGRAQHARRRMQRILGMHCQERLSFLLGRVLVARSNAMFHCVSRARPRGRRTQRAKQSAQEARKCVLGGIRAHVPAMAGEYALYALLAKVCGMRCAIVIRTYRSQVEHLAPPSARAPVFPGWGTDACQAACAWCAAAAGQSRPQGHSTPHIAAFSWPGSRPERQGIEYTLAL